MTSPSRPDSAGRLGAPGAPGGTPDGAATARLVAMFAPVVLPLFIGLYAASALAAYAIGPVPIQWLAQIAFIGLGIAHLFVTRRGWHVPGIRIMLAFLGWAVIVNALNAGRFEGMMPAYATLPYWMFVILRYASVVSFLFAFYLAFWLLWAGRGEELTRGVVRVGVFFAAVAIYIYVAGLVGLPEPPRTRLGTGGFAGQVTGTFSSAGLLFRRAIGTFREPSHLADWLLLPFFVSLGRSGTRARIATGVIALALLLTVSLQGIISVIAAMTIVTVLTNPFRFENMRRIVGALVLVGLLLAGVGGMSIGALGDGVRVIDVMNARTLELTSGGVGATSRSSVLEFIASHVPPPLGYGFGNASIFASHELAYSVVMSYLSMYAYVLYSTGYVGLALLIGFQGTLLVRALVRQGRLRRLGAGPTSIMAFVAYMVSSAAGMEELTIPFAIAAALIAYEGFARRPVPGGEPSDQPLVRVAASEASVPIGGLARQVAGQRRLLGGLAAVVAIGAVLVGITRADRYTATSAFVITPARPLGATLGGASGASETSGPTADPQFYVDLLRSRALLGRVVDATSGSGTSATDTARTAAGGPEARERLAAREEAIDRLRRRVIATLDQPTSMIHLVVTDEDPAVARRMNERLIALLDEFDGERRRTEAELERRFTEPRLAEAADRLRQADDALRRFRTRNRGGLTAPALRREHDRLVRDVAVWSARYRSAVGSHERVLAAQARQVSVIGIIDRPYAASSPDPRRLVTRGVAGVVAGMVLGMGIVLLLGIGTPRGPRLARMAGRDAMAYAQ